MLLEEPGLHSENHGDPTGFQQRGMPLAPCWVLAIQPNTTDRFYLPGTHYLLEWGPVEGGKGDTRVF